MKLDTDKVLALSAMVVGVASLVVVVYQAQLQREQMELERESARAERRAQAASVLPYLMFVTTMNQDGVFLNLRNTGLGPARIDRVRVLHGGSELPGDAVDFFMKFRRDPNMPTDIDQLTEGRLVPAGEWIRTLGSGPANREPMVIELLRLFEIAELPRNLYEAYDAQMKEKGLPPRERAVVEVSYSSVFGERWVLRSDTMVPQPATPNDLDRVPRDVASLR